MFADQVCFLRRNITFIDYGAISSHEVVATVNEIGIGYAQPRSDKLVDIDSCPGADVDPSRVHKENSAVGQKCPVNIRRVRREDSVQHRSTAAGLNELNRFRPCNVKPAVIYDGLVGDRNSCVVATSLD